MFFAPAFAKNIKWLDVFPLTIESSTINIFFPS